MFFKHFKHFSRKQKLGVKSEVKLIQASDMKVPVRESWKMDTRKGYL